MDNNKFSFSAWFDSMFANNDTKVYFATAVSTLWVCAN